jgi:hypothetical protein
MDYACVLLVLALLHGEPSPDHVQGVGGTHGNDACPSTRRKSQKWGHPAVTTVVLRFPGNVPDTPQNLVQSKDK